MNVRGAHELDAAELLQAIPEAIVIVDGRHHIVAANDFALDMFGWSWDDLADHPIEVLVPERDRETHRHQASEYMQAPEARPMGIGRRLYAQRRDGTRFLAEIALGPVPRADDTWILAVVRDITERARTEREFQEMQHKLRNLM